MSAWSLYDELIDAIPSGITVHDYCLGAHWTYIVADCGMGIAKTVRGGGKSRFKQSPVDVDLKTLAALAKSWNWLEASLGVAAINAYYATPDAIESLGGTIDEDVAESGDVSNPFHRLKGRYTGRKVAVVGHFPNVDEMRKVAQVTVLERNCTSPTDTPDPACEYILPEQDYVFVTGTSLTNKTMPRLLELSRESKLYVLGPSVVPAQAFFERGVNGLAGSVVIDAKAARAAVKGGSKAQWRAGIKKFMIEA